MGSEQVTDSVYAGHPIPHASTGMTVNSYSHSSVGECYEIIINGVLNENGDASEEIINEIAFAALNKVLPSLERLRYSHPSAAGLV